MDLKLKDEFIDKGEGDKDGICDLRNEVLDKFKLKLSLEISLIGLGKDELIDIINEIYK